MPQAKYNTAGGALTGTIFDALAEQERLKRQALIDSIASERLKMDQAREGRLAASDAADTAYKGEALASLKQQREAAAKEAEQRAKIAEQTAAGTFSDKVPVGPVDENTANIMTTAGRGSQIDKTLPSTQQTIGTVMPAGPPAPNTAVAPQANLPGVVKQYAGGTENLGSAEQKAMTEIMNNPAIPLAVRQAAQIGDKAALTEWLKNQEDKSKSLIRVNPSKDKPEIFQAGQWTPVTDTIPEKATVLQQAQPPASLTLGASADIDAIKEMANHYAQTGQLLTRNPALASRVMDEYAKMRVANPSLSAVSNMVDLGADKASLNNLQKQFDSVQAFKNTAKQNIEVLKSRLATIPDAGVTLLNKPWRWVSANLLSDPKMAGFASALGTVQPELSRILNSANLTGVNTVHAQQEIEKLLNPNYTVAQFLDALSVFEQDMNNREMSTRQQLEEIRGRVDGRGPNAGSVTPSPTTPAPTVRRYNPATGKIE